MPAGGAWRRETVHRFEGPETAGSCHAGRARTTKNAPKRDIQICCTAVAQILIICQRLRSKFKRGPKTIPTLGPGLVA